MTTKWVYASNPSLGVWDGLGRELGVYERQHPNAFPDMQTDHRMLVVSDYSGDLKNAKYRAYALLISPFEGIRQWNPVRKEIRNTLLQDGRSMSYKKVSSDRIRAEALVPFLSATNLINGLLLVLLVDKSIDSLFETNGKNINEIPELRSLGHWKPRVLEDALRVTSMACCVLNGLAKPDQIVIWLSDQDATVANGKFKNEFRDILANTAQWYPRTTQLKMEILTTDELGVDNRLAEDIAAIPDLAAGGLVHLLDEWPVFVEALRLGLSIPTPTHLQPKTQTILRWLQDDAQDLKRLILIVDANPESHGLNAMVLKFHSEQIDQL